MQVAIKLENGEISTGDSRSMTTIGEMVWIELHDENGLPITQYGEVLEIF